MAYTKLFLATFLCLSGASAAQGSVHTNLISCQGTQGSLVNKCQVAQETVLAAVQPYESDFRVDYRMTCNRNYRGPKPSFSSLILENGQSLALQYNFEGSNLLVGTGNGPLILRDAKPIDLSNLQFNGCELVFTKVTASPSARVLAEREAEKARQRAVRTEYLRLTREQVELNSDQLVGQQSNLYFRTGQRIASACLIRRYETDPIYQDLIADLRNSYVATFGSDASVTAEECASRSLPKVSLRGLTCDLFTVEGIQKQLARGIPAEDRFFYESCQIELNYTALLDWFDQKKTELSKVIAEVEAEGLADIRAELEGVFRKVDSALGSSCSESSCQVVDVAVEELI